ncbi:MAG: hypothetical protein M9962_12240 [Oligoflexia bacterium]|nr:hypothetical protein [Oligoflexia bacterium]
MSRSWWLRFGLLVFFIVVAFVHVIPTVGNLDLETTKFPFKKKVNLGLDLQGGLYMVYGVDFKRVYKDSLERSVDSFRNELEKEGVRSTVGQINQDIEEDPKILVQFENANSTKFDAALEKQNFTLRRIEPGSGGVVVGLARDYRLLIKENTLNQSVQVVRNRIDEFGVTEPSITTKGDNRVVVELPGVKDIERAKALVGRTARLEFKMVNTNARIDLVSLVANLEKEKGISFKEGQKFSDYIVAINEAAKGKIPEDSQILFERLPGQNIPFLLHSKVELTGSELTDAPLVLIKCSNARLLLFN